MCWAVVYDFIASHYHYSIGDFLKLTQRQVCFLTEAISKRINQEREFNASLHGIKLKAPTPACESNFKELSKEQINKCDNILDKILCQKKI